MLSTALGTLIVAPVASSYNRFQIPLLSHIQSLLWCKPAGSQTRKLQVEVQSICGSCADLCASLKRQFSKSVVGPLRPIMQVSGVCLDLHKCRSVLLAWTVPASSKTKEKRRDEFSHARDAASARQGSQIALMLLIHTPDPISSVMQFAFAGSSVPTEPVKNRRASEILAECSGFIRNVKCTRVT